MGVVDEMGIYVRAFERAEVDVNEAEQNVTTPCLNCRMPRPMRGRVTAQRQPRPVLKREYIER
jgi:hypothetical protein